MPQLKIRKIINDPVYGFITIDDALILKLISHPYYQRLRYIHQMAFAHLVYPGAVHTRLHHSLGAYQLITYALEELKSKGIEINNKECQAAKLAILLHDIGHGPFSHALEGKIVSLSHEDISLKIMQQLNEEFKGKLQLAIDIFKNQYSKKFLHQLISGQLDVDRMDYLSRDSFFTGVAEGVIGYDRILKMLTVKNDALLVEEKGIYSIEKFLVARRLMYLQVYLHKTVLAAELMLSKIIERVKELITNGISVPCTSEALAYFLNRNVLLVEKKELALYCNIDDTDILASIKIWSLHSDKILAHLCKNLIQRKLYKTTFNQKPYSKNFILNIQKKFITKFKIKKSDVHYFLITGTTSNLLYNSEKEKINILFKNGSIKDITQVDHALLSFQKNTLVKKHYICKQPL